MDWYVMSSWLIVSEAHIFVNEEYIRWSNTTTSNNKIIIVTHALHCLDDFGFVIRNYFDPFEVLRKYISSSIVTGTTISLTIPNEKQNFAIYAELV